MQWCVPFVFFFNIHIVITIRLDSSDLTPFERDDVKAALEREIAGSWLTDEIRRRKPTPEEEAMGGFAVIEQNLCILVT